MNATRCVLRSVLLAGFAMLGAACEDPCGTPSAGIELFAAEGELPPGTYEIEITVAGVSARSVCEIDAGDADELHCTSEGGKPGGPPPITLWVSETRTEISGGFTADPGALILSVTYDGEEIVNEEHVLETEEVQRPGNFRSITCESLVPTIEVELPLPVSDA
jgi:hypothetical protein